MDDNESVLIQISEQDEKKKEPDYKFHVFRIVNNACDQKKKQELQKLLADLGISEEIILESAEQRKCLKRKMFNSMLRLFYENKENDKSDLLFYASAQFDLIKIRTILKELETNTDSFVQDITQTRCSDSVIVFALKYGDITKNDFYNCIKELTEAGIDINRLDFKGKSAIDLIALFYKQYKNDATMSTILKNVATLFLEKGLYAIDNKDTAIVLKNDMKLVLPNDGFVSGDGKTHLFRCIMKNDTKSFLNFQELQKYVNVDDSENTLLQFASKRSDNMLPVVQHLLKNGADPNKVTPRNKLTPLELAAKNNNQKIFEELLKHVDTKITQENFNNFVRWRLKPMKGKLFKSLLESDKIEPQFTYDRSGNTALHYAVSFSHKEAIQKLLKRNSSLIVKNKLNKCVLDMIDPEDLEKHFDSCLVLDNYAPYFSDINYKMRFRFNCLVDSQEFRESRVVSMIGKQPNLERLLTHPFIHTFVTLKWFKIKFYFWIILMLQLIMFILLSVAFYRFPKSVPENVFTVLLSVICIAIKAPIFLHFRIVRKSPIFVVLNEATLHAATEICLMATIIGGFFQLQFRGFLFIEIAVCFLLTTGYHPNLSKWSLMLQRVFKTFTILLIFFSLPVVAFSIGFHILFPSEKLFNNFFTSIFKTFIMTTGEFNIEDDANFSFGGYLIFVFFAMSMSLVIVNFWTGVAVTDIERIERHSEVNAFKNLILFMTFIEHIYNIKCLEKFRKYIPTPLLFLRIDEKGCYFIDIGKCDVDYYVNRSKQFDEKTEFPSKLDDDCFNKIRNHYFKQTEITNEKLLLGKLEQVLKTLEEIKANNSARCNYHDDSNLATKQKKGDKDKKPK
jgi:ankyrin repeat protein